MSTVLAKEVTKHENIQVFKDFFVFNLLKNADSVVGLIGIDMLTGDTVVINAKTTVVAAGGYASITCLRVPIFQWVFLLNVHLSGYHFSLVAVALV